jgi:hypothetical protein
MLRRLFSTIAVPLCLSFSGAALALPPGEAGRGFRDGANHHLGDDGFVAEYQRAPAPHEPEQLRMHAHFAHVREWLASRPPTRPELADKRRELLGFLDDYIATGTTPSNAHLPWRTPVFIDDAGTVCAVGYLIERSSGRALAEKIASTHRYDFLEDIVSAMPEVASWANESGFTLEELASIQPGYMMPVVEGWRPWDLAKSPLPNGAYANVSETEETHGTIKDGAMEGTWTRIDAQKHEVGRGTFAHGGGAWESKYPGGARLARGRYVHNHPEGTWRFYHQSGRLAAIGRFDNGIRSGEWQFFHDTSASNPIAIGSFDRGTVTGVWRHYDSHGQLLAVSRDRTPAQWSDWGRRPAGHLLDIVPGADGVHHWVHEGDVEGDFHRADMLLLGATQLFVVRQDTFYDADGNLLRRGDAGAWTKSDCHWSDARKHAAHAGDLVTLHGLVGVDFYAKKTQCDEARSVSAARGRRYDAMLASIRGVRSPSPKVVRDLVLGDYGGEGDDANANESDDARTAKEIAADLTKVLASNMTWYVEWPHVDGRFMEVFKTLAGYAPDSNAQ